MQGDFTASTWYHSNLEYLVRAQQPKPAPTLAILCIVCIFLAALKADQEVRFHEIVDFWEFAPSCLLV